MQLMPQELLKFSVQLQWRGCAKGFPWGKLAKIFDF